MDVAPSTSTLGSAIQTVFNSENAPIQALSSQFLQGNTVENAVKALLKSKREHPQPSPHPLCRSSCHRRTLGQSSRTLHVIILRHFWSFQHINILCVTAATWKSIPSLHETTDERISQHTIPQTPLCCPQAISSPGFILFPLQIH